MINSLDVSELISYFKKTGQAGYILCICQKKSIDKANLVNEIKQNSIDRLVLAGDLPGLKKTLCASAMIEAGKNPEEIAVVDFVEYGLTDNEDRELAKALLICAIYDVSFEEVSVPEENPVNPDTLVIGGGIAGIQASLEIANGHQNVYLVERSPTIGGHMAMFDKTFPTLDCAACILTPKMVEVGQHPRIKLMTYSEVIDVNGPPGNYTVKILKNARKVNLDLCTGCGTCAEKCPSTVLNEFDLKTSTRKAIYIPFPQAVPNKYLIDEKHCTYLRKGKCGVCAKVCPVTGCINFDEKDEVIEIKVGNIIVATGFKTFDPKRIEQFGYGKYPNVITSLEFERLANASGPTAGDIKYKAQDKKGNWLFSPESDEPKRLAIIHCVGSRDENYNHYCSRVCCMYSLKIAHLIKEKLEDAEVYEYYIDMRAAGKGYEEFYERIKNEGVHIIRGRTAKIEENENGLLLRTEDIVNNRLIEQEVDMVILSVGLEPKDDTVHLSKILGIPLSDDGWFKEFHSVSAPVKTYAGGIRIAGTCQGPKDIPDTVAQAAAAASDVLQTIMRNKIPRDFKELDPQEIIDRVKELSTT